MQTLSPQLVAALSLTGGVASAMVMVARSYGMLERPAERHCAACGRRISRREPCRCSS